MGIGFSLAQNTSEQLASSDVVQNFTGTCDISCQNIESGTTIDIQNSTINGGIKFDQQCSASGQCLFAVTQNATVDTLFFAKNSAQASNAGGWLNGFLNSDISTNASYQDIRQNINQSIEEHCKIDSLNELDRLTILANNSTINGGIDISQDGNAHGVCSMHANFVGSAQATGNVDNSAQSGKKVGKKASKGTMILLIFGAIALLIIGIVVAIIVFHKANPVCPGNAKAIKSGGRFSKSVCPPQSTTK